MQKKLAAVVIVALGITLSAAPALAGAAAEDLSRGKTLLKEMEDAKALKAFEAALTGEGINDKLRAEIYLQRGIALSNLLNRAAAIESFKSALAADPEITPPALTSPKIKVLFDEVKRKAREEAEKAKPKARPEPKPEPKPRPTPEPAPAPEPASINWPAWILLGGAAVAGGVGIAMGALSKSDSDKAADLELTYGQALEHHDRAETRALVANILLPVAGAAALTAGLLFFLDRRTSEQPSAAVVPLEGGVLVQVNGVRF